MRCCQSARRAASVSSHPRAACSGVSDPPIVLRENSLTSFANSTSEISTLVRPDFDVKASMIFSLYAIIAAARAGQRRERIRTSAHSVAATAAQRHGAVVRERELFERFWQHVASKKPLFASGIPTRAVLFRSLFLGVRAIQVDVHFALLPLRPEARLPAPAGWYPVPAARAAGRGSDQGSRPLGQAITPVREEYSLPPTYVRHAPHRIRKVIFVHGWYVVISFLLPRVPARGWPSRRVRCAGYPITLIPRPWLVRRMRPARPTIPGHPCPRRNACSPTRHTARDQPRGRSQSISGLQALPRAAQPRPGRRTATRPHGRLSGRPTGC